ncbi:hypothetical protein [Streptomyces sp. NPDC059389]
MALEQLEGKHPRAANDLWAVLDALLTKDPVASAHSSPRPAPRRPRL